MTRVIYAVGRVRTPIVGFKPRAVSLGRAAAKICGNFFSNILKRKQYDLVS